MKTPTLLILGHGRHGKDSAAEYFRDNFGMQFQSSSVAAAELFIFDELKDKYGYNTFQQCFEDRVNHRKEWHDLICDYNSEDKARLAKGILKNNSCYVGMRSNEEVKACIEQGLFDLIIWVDASERLPLENPDSFNIDVSVADIIVDNNGTLEEFHEKLHRLGLVIFKTTI